LLQEEWQGDWLGLSAKGGGGPLALLRDLLVRPVWRGQRVGKRNVLVQAKAKLARERERYTVLWEWQLDHGLSASKHLLFGYSFPSVGWDPWDQNRVHQ